LENAFLQNAVIYLRVSTDRQAEKDLSLPTQLHICEKFAHEQGFSVLKVFEDAGESARTSDRPSFLEMIDFCLAQVKAFNIAAVICWDTSRFARNRADAILHKRQLGKKGIKVLFASQPIADGPEGEFLEGILESADEFYSKQLSRNIIRGMEENARRGFRNGARTPFGYRLIRIQDEKGNQKGRLEIDEVEAEAVRTMFRLCLDGYGCLATADQLAKRGILDRGGRPFTKKSVEKMLGNVAYMGTLRFRNISIDNVHPAVISKSVFGEVQRIRKERSPEKIPGRSVASSLLFSSLLFCGSCGRKLTFERTFKPSKTYTYYSCSSFKNRQSDCSERLRFDAGKLDNFLAENIADRILNDGNVERIMRNLMRMRDEALNRSRSRILKIRSELHGVQKRINNLIEAVADGTLSRELIKEKMQKLIGDKEALESELFRGEVSTLPKMSFSQESIQEFRGFCREVLLEGELRKRQTFLKSFVKKIDLTKTNCEVHYDLARLIAARHSRQAGSSLRDGLVDLGGIEPPTCRLREHRRPLIISISYGKD
jgi:site-specific DNA recombinase